MNDPQQDHAAEPTAERDLASAEPRLPQAPLEVGGRGGLEPTRYGDWEKAGRCIDF